MADSVLNVRVVSPASVVFQGDAASLVVPVWDGLVGILPGHAPFLALIGAGQLSVDLPGGGSRTFHVAGGVLKVLANQVTVLTEYAGDRPPETIPPDAILHEEDVAASASEAPA